MGGKEDIDGDIAQSPIDRNSGEILVYWGKHTEYLDDEASVFLC